MLSDPWFYAAAIPSVLLVGLSKGGLGGAMALLGVPLMSLVVPPVQAAAILLPILIVMDMVGLWSWRHHSDRMTLKIMLPGAMIGIGIAWMTAAFVTDAMIKLLVGVVALIFALDYARRAWQLRGGAPSGERPHNRVKGAFWGTVSGFTSFISHAGGPPYQVYALALRQEPRTYVGTSVRFFAVVNAVKVVPYLALGQFDASNLQASLVLLPLAPIATLAGAAIVRRIRAERFYPFMYGMVFLAALKLIWDGLGGLLA
ncbi:sulfite exporter TauE/SafE family protein [Georhizobium sp. MAB10]|uniref:sulfite exporter TauE/SafE family protein n=1 Tax=Georhizobium sp. MAB10 TaxID=3028319 RepID=UPI0038558856